MGEPLASFRITRSPDGSAMVAISGELDMSTVDELEDELRPLLDTAPARLIVDVSSVRFADSSAIALWVRWAGAVPDFELRDPPPLLRRVLATMGLSAKLGVAA
ncbi:MAG TPA: STAS domain-containing protein [Solirubrobacteraceae bacterium]|jgi:anti-anti-sigma factor|nr:STAS domain-containing protein [Solirubrobacteraceae bacterium]